jgi:hypothetical protein
MKLNNQTILDPSLYCENEIDCVLINMDCTGCSCDNFKVMNKEHAYNLCRDVSIEVMCDLVCESFPYNFKCIDNECK